jgi:hypothetical protein
VTAQPEDQIARYRRDEHGQLRITVTVDFELSVDDLACAVAECLDDELPVTKRNVERSARELMHFSGDDGLTFYFERSEQDEQDCLRRARALFAGETS